jgi:hypothetical protein
LKKLLPAKQKKKIREAKLNEKHYIKTVNEHTNGFFILQGAI